LLSGLPSSSFLQENSAAENTAASSKSLNGFLFAENIVLMSDFV
jgi:hypothetical protein